MICLSTTASTPAAIGSAVARNEKWIDMVEFRLDFLDEITSETIEPLRSVGVGKGRILTIRREVDGGQFGGPEEARLRLLSRALELLRPEYVDLEDDLLETAEGESLASEAEAKGVRIIRSVHDFEGTPTELEDRLLRLEEAPGAVAKYAVTTNSTRDLRILLRAARAAAKAHPEKERVLLGMGVYGVPSRLLPGEFGSKWSYCSDRGGDKSAAPGHLSPQELVERFAYSEAWKGAPLFAVLGDPVLHSGSPAYHNRRFREAGVEAAYIAFPADDIEPTMALFDELGIRGVSVTIPHKQEVLAYLGEQEPAVTALGAANTLLRRTDGWVGRNSDVPGFLEPLNALETDLSGKRALVIGGGGAARAVVYALLGEQVEVTVANRTYSRAAALVEEVTGGDGQVAGTSAVACRVDASRLRETEYDLVVQTTSVGMDGESEPIPGFPFRKGQIAYDIIYTPPMTPFLKRAAEAGATVVTGDKMFEAQAAVQFEAFLELARGSEPA